jgi:succinate dehydrogenase / fumarate reductase flavoprotein subunit
MQGLADGYFVIPYTLGDYIASNDLPEVSTDNEAFAEAEKTVSAQYDKMLSINGNKTVMEFHRELGAIIWDQVGMSRTAEGLTKAIEQIRELKKEFWTNLKLTGEKNTYNKYLEHAGRVADFFELGELMAIDALHREESCGGHFREDHQTEEGEALRNDEDFSYVAAWKYSGDDELPSLIKENLEFDFVQLTQRSYK